MKSIVRAKKKTNRSLHANLWGDPKSPFLKREYGPGQHGARKKKLTDYGEQLQAKQRLKTYYGLSHIHISEPTRLGMVSYAVVGVK